MTFTQQQIDDAAQRYETEREAARERRVSRLVRQQQRAVLAAQSRRAQPRG